MTSENQEKSKDENDDEKAKDSLETEINGAYQKRDELWSRNWCPFCGRTDCKSKLHFLKLYTLPMSSLPPKYAFLMRVVPFGILLLLIIGGKILYLMFTKN
ncbi:MAG: hypothetical protein A2076_00850 [Geobacteraceae bacterium GWC2_53_11]|nr:MAG: hypothetical protein A2076_00850 [Geobacteraceae bacterium GWC2_53_11]